MEEYSSHLADMLFPVRPVLIFGRSYKMEPQCKPEEAVWHFFKVDLRPRQRCALYVSWAAMCFQALNLFFSYELDNIRMLVCGYVGKRWWTIVFTRQRK